MIMKEIKKKLALNMSNLMKEKEKYLNEDKIYSLLTKQNEE